MVRIDRVVMVTGATGSVGPHVARAVAETGARLVLTARRPEALDALAGELGLDPDRVLYHAADLAVEAQVEALMAVVAERWGGVDVLLNVAGGWSGGSRIADVSAADWQAGLAMNLQSAFLINRAVLPHMVAQEWGRIVNFGSKAVEDPGARQVAYNVAKAGVVALTRSIAAEYRRSGVAANAVLPSIIDTPDNRSQMPDADHSRWVTPQQIVELLLFLMSEAAGSLNGAAIPLYGRV